MWQKVAAAAGLIALVLLPYFTGDTEGAVMLLCFFSLSIAILFARLSQPSVVRNICMYASAAAAFLVFTAYMVGTWGDRQPTAGILVLIGSYPIHAILGQKPNLFNESASEPPAGVNQP